MRRSLTLALILSGLGVGTLVAVDAVPFNVRQIVIRNRDDCDNVPKPDGCPGAVGGSPLSRNEHPRLIMTLQNRPAMLARIETGGEWNTDFKNWINEITQTGVWDYPTNGNIIYNGHLAAGVGFVYQMALENGGVLPDIGMSYPTNADTVSEWTTKGVSRLMAQGGDFGWMGEYTRTWFLAYDWLNPALSGAQKQTLVSDWKANTESDGTFVSIVSSYPSYSSWGYWQSHHPGAIGYWVLAGVVAKGDGTSEESWLQTGIDRYNFYFRNPDLPSGHRAGIVRESQRSGLDGGNFQGWYYGQVLTHRIGMVEVGYRTANAISVADFYGTYGWMRGWVPYLVRTMRPYTWNPALKYRQYINELGTAADGNTSNLSFREQAAYARMEFQGFDDEAADLAIWFLENRGNNEAAPEEHYLTKFVSPKGTGRSPDVVYASDKDKWTYAGKWQWRTGWDSVNDAVVQIQASRWYAGIGGYFTIDYGGPAMPLCGYRNHDEDSFANAAWCRNNLLFVDPSRSTCETSGCVCDDYGGPRQCFDENAMAVMTEGSSADFDTSPVRWRTTATESEGIGYLSLNMTRQYNGPTVKSPASIEEKVSSYRRSWIYIPPATPGTSSLRLFLFDSATAVSTTYEKRQQFGSFAEPVIDGSSSAGPSRGGTTDRKTTYTGATHIRMDQSTALSGATRVYVTPLAPSVKVVKVGFRFDVTNHHSETSFGNIREESWSGDALGDYEAYGHWWRVELIPNTLQTTDHFATALETCPNTSCARSTTAAVSGTDITGGRIGSAVATHTTTLDDNSFSIVMPDVSTTFTVAFCGATPDSSRTLSKGGSIGTVTQTRNSDTTSPYTFNAAGCFVGTVVVTSGGNEASRTLTWN